MTKKTDTPAIRFKGFSDTWEQRKLGELGTITTGNTPSTSIPDYYSDDGIVWVTPTDICENITFESARKLSDLGQQVGRVVPKNTILVTCIASIGKNTMLGNTGSFNQQINGLTPNENKYDPYFLLTESALWSAKMKGSAASGTMQIVNRTEFSELKTWLPSLIEQQAIGAFFKQLDNLITLHQRKYEKLHNIKKSMLEKMFPKNGSNVPEIRFKGFTEAWEQRKLTEFVEFFSGLTYTPNDVQENGTLVLRSSNVSNGEVVDADNIYVNPQVVNSENVKVGDIVVVVRNGSRSLIGKHAQIKAFMPNTVIGAFMTGIRSECPEFTNALLNTSRFEEEIAMNMGATINQITRYMFSKMEFKVPCLDEQKKIGEYFEKLDNLITLHQRELEKLQNIKKSMLEKMFV